MVRWLSEDPRPGSARPVSVSCPGCGHEMPRAPDEPAQGPDPGVSPDPQHGVFALFADGDERFLSDKTETKILRALCTMAGGEEVEDDGF